MKDTIEIVSGFNELEYIVIGGWCPVLRKNSNTKHPGTLDVDILFRKSNISGELREVIQGFINNGFMPSAKHKFQVLKPQKIKGKNIIYNVDLLHPKMLEDKENVGMFVDHLDLDIPLNNNEKKLKALGSIVLPNSEILFSESLYDIYSYEGLKFNLVSFDGMFITKMDSCQKQKRERDSFDIYIAFTNNGINVENINLLAEKDNRIKESLISFKLFLKNKAEIFNENVKQFDKSVNTSPAKYILNELQA